MKRIAFLVSVLLPCLLAVSCGKENKGGEEDGAPAQLAVVVNDAKSIYEVARNLSLTLSLAVTADPVSAEAYTITLGPKAGLVASYNSANGTNYELLPSSAYSLSTASIMLTRYSPKSTAVELRLTGDGCEQDKLYVLPIGIDAVQGGTNFQAPDDKVAFVVFKATAPEQLGSGKSGDPYIIENLDGFLKIGSMMQDDATTYFKLGADIDFAEVEYTDENPWTPFNYATADEDVAAAEKRMIVLDGDNHKISNFTASAPLFGVLVGSVQNLTIENAKVTAERNDGGILAMFGGTAAAATETLAKNVIVKNSEVYNEYKRSGGLISWVKGGVLENVEVNCKVSAEQQAGGLVGRMEAGSIINSCATGDVTSNIYYAGGLVGFAGSVTVKDSYAAGNVESASGNYTRSGGLIGHIAGDSTIERCHATGNVTGAGHFAGGLVGEVQGTADKTTTLTIKASYATGNVTLPITNNFAHAGGLLGSVLEGGYAVISDCYATGTIVVRRYSGGFVGTMGNANSKLSVTNSYTTSDISGINLAERSGMFLGNDNGVADITVKGFIAWDVSNSGRFAYSAEAAAKLIEGNYLGTEGTVSKKAAEFKWDTNIWDLSGDFPKLK